MDKEKSKIVKQHQNFMVLFRIEEPKKNNNVNFMVLPRQGKQMEKALIISWMKRKSKELNTIRISWYCLKQKQEPKEQKKKIMRISWHCLEQKKEKIVVKINEDFMVLSRIEGRII